MGIKWEDVKISTSVFTNNIYLGKVKLDKENPQTGKWTDRSGDKTDEVIIAVFNHMIERMEQKGYTSYQLNGYELSIRKMEESEVE